MLTYISIYIYVLPTKRSAKPERAVVRWVPQRLAALVYISYMYINKYDIYIHVYMY